VETRRVCFGIFMMFEFSEAKNRQRGIYSFYKNETIFIYGLIKKFVTGYFVTYAKTHQKNFFVEKTPSHELCLPLINYCFPRAKIIYCLRDGRDVWLSHREICQHDQEWKAAPAAIDQVARTWCQSVNICFNQREFDRSQFYIMRYEKLISDPYKQTEQLFQFCEVRADEISRDVLSKNLKYNYNVIRYNNYQVGFPGKWKTNMSNSEKERFKEIAGQELIKAGYETDLDW
jgi:sulfotransferase family protein